MKPGNGTRESREACGRSCKYWTHDMDGAFCCHPKSFEVAPTWGASTNRMSLEGHCMGGYDDPAKNTRALWEPAKPTFTGFTNAVRAARSYLESIGADIDAASFDKMEAERGNAPPEALANGFVVDSMDAMSRLCGIAQFNVVVKAGVCYAEPS